MQFLDEFLDINDFEKRKKICEGKCKKVFEVSQKNTNITYVAKMSVKETYLFSKDEINDYYHDIIINAKLNHPAIINFIGFSPIDFEGRGKLVVITEYASNGPLTWITESKKPNISEWNFTKKLINIYGIASAMSYLHSHDIVHCNLQTKSILVDEHYYPKLFYFNRSKEINDNAPNQSEQPTKSSEVYEFALLIYEILLNKKLIDAAEEEDDDSIIDETIPDCYYELIENCLAREPEERPTFEAITKLLETNREFITEEVNETEYRNYIKMIKEYPVTFDDSEPIFNPQKLINKFEKRERSRIIEKLFVLKKSKELMEFLNDYCDKETISVTLDKCFAEHPDMYQALLNEGISINNSVAHQKYALSLLFDNNNDEKAVFQKAEHHLEESIKQGFVSSYFSLAVLSYQFFNKKKFAFYLAEEGAKKGEINSRCLLGYFIAHGIGTEKDHKKGVEIMLECVSDDHRDDFATDIGIYFIEKLQSHKELLGQRQAGEEKEAKVEDEATNKPSVESSTQNADLEEATSKSSNDIDNANDNANDNDNDAAATANDDDDDDDDGLYEIVEYDEEVEYEYEEEIDDQSAFFWFERAYNLNKTKATINNYGLCFLHGIGVPKDVEKAKQILSKVTRKLDPKTLCQLHFIPDEQISEEVTLDAEPTKDQISSQLRARSPRRINPSFRSSSSRTIPKLNIVPPTNAPAPAHKDVEKVRKQLNKMIHAGNCYIPIQYAFNLYKEKNFKKAFYYFSIISRVNNPIAQFFVGLMKYRGEGCPKNVDEAMEIMKNLSNIGNDMATQFFNEFF